MTEFCFSGMKEEDHYVRVVVDGLPVPDSALCDGNPYGAKCTFKVRVLENPVIWKKPEVYISMQKKANIPLSRLQNIF